MAGDETVLEAIELDAKEWEMKALVVVLHLAEMPVPHSGNSKD